MSLVDTPRTNLVKGESSYSDPTGVITGTKTPSSIGEQFNTFYYYKKALIEIRKKQVFQQLANTRAMPKHMGKTIKQYKYIPVLDDRNVNDQGINAAGVKIEDNDWRLMAPDGTITPNPNTVTTPLYANKAAAEAAAATNGTGQTVFLYSGGLYGSSKDIGVITAKLPPLSEHGGRVNRIGHTRVTLEASITKHGFFSEYTQESLDFDTDSELLSHITTESLVAANEMVEDAVQKDLINGAGVIRFTGNATNNASIDGTCELTYTDLMRLSIDLDDNNCPKDTKLISGSRMIDTRVIAGARYLICGSEMIPTFEAMVDLHGRPALKHIEEYAAAGKIANGEYGSIGPFRLIIAQEMMAWHGAGAAATDPAFRQTAGHYDVIPLLVIGSGCFTHIGFQTNGKNVKFKIYHKRPGMEMVTSHDPYGEKGLWSIKWYYGIMILRPEWLALIKTAAKY